MPEQCVKDSAAASGEPAGQAAIAQIGRLVAMLKAERDRPNPPRRRDDAERSRLGALLRQLLAAHDQERAGWEAKLRDLEAQLAGAKAEADAARREQEQAAAAHKRAMADLELLHEHQRSIWTLERRRLEITLSGVESATRQRRSRLKVALGLAATLLVLGAVAGLGLHASQGGVTEYLPRG